MAVKKQKMERVQEEVKQQKDQPKGTQKTNDTRIHKMCWLGSRQEEAETQVDITNTGESKSKQSNRQKAKLMQDMKENPEFKVKMGNNEEN